MIVCNRKNQQESKWKFFDFLKIIFYKKYVLLKKQILFYFLVYLQIANLWFINKNIFHGNGNGIDWNFIGNCSVKITLLSKSKSRIFNKIFNSKIFSNPELGKIVKLIMITYNIHWLIIKKSNNCKKK